MGKLIKVEIKSFIERSRLLLDLATAGFDLSCETPTLWIDERESAQLVISDVTAGGTKYSVKVREAGSTRPWSRVSGGSESAVVTEAKLLLELLAVPDDGNMSNAPGGASLKVKRRGHGG